MATKPTVYAVMKANIEISVRPSGSGETFEQMFEAARNEAEDILRNKIGNEARIIGKVEFSHAVVKGGA